MTDLTAPASQDDESPLSSGRGSKHDHLSKLTNETHSTEILSEEDILDAFCLYVMRQVENDPRLVKALTHALAAAWGKAFHDKQYLIEHVVEALRAETQDAAEYWRRMDEGKRIAEAGALRQPRQRRTSQNPNTGWW